MPTFFKQIFNIFLGETERIAGGCLYLGVHGLQHSLVQAELQRRLVEHLPLVSVPTQQAIDLDAFLLADPVATRLRLEVVLGVPVAVVNDDGVGGRQVDPETAGFRAQKEHEPVRIGLAKPIYSRLSQVASDPSIQSLVRIPKVRPFIYKDAFRTAQQPLSLATVGTVLPRRAERELNKKETTNLLAINEIVFNDIEQFDHLRKYENPVSIGFQSGQKFVNKNHLARRLN